ncbi:Stb3p [Sugiyamaella lignohabitans]|uniref:Stb3p n=1 Tax=Sugiyamaella lignohabitans TaxID=796027 RepID=A0A167DJ65_9ASCO|nr:Stb3p [Sugiyamaella lignohabitans]ANB12976.1 Stb3p [Sugiyamaella lignohabitans]
MSALSVALNGLRSHDHTTNPHSHLLSHSRSPPPALDGYSNLRGSPPNGIKHSLANGSTDHAPGNFERLAVFANGSRSSSIDGAISSSTSAIDNSAATPASAVGASTGSGRSGSPTPAQRFVNVPRTTVDTLGSSPSAFSPLSSNSYRLTNNLRRSSLSPAGSVSSSTGQSIPHGSVSPIATAEGADLIAPPSPTSANAANVLLQTAQLSQASSQKQSQPIQTSQVSNTLLAQPSSLSRQLAQSATRHYDIPKTSNSSNASSVNNNGSSTPRNRRLSNTVHTPTGSYGAKASPGLHPVGSASSSLLKSHLIQSSTTPVGSPGAASNGPLNTNSPVAIAAAAAVTPDKLSRLLLTQGPLAIRHITSHLALTINGFADLSLSKQRRLIIAVLDSGDPVNSVVFEKVGWGRWAARKTDSPAAAAAAASAASAANNGSSKHRRDSISAELVSSSVNPPISPVLNAVDSHYLSSSLKNSITTAYADDVDLADDDMMFHNSVIRKPVRPSHLLQGALRSRRHRRPSQKMRERIAFGAEGRNMDDSDNDDDDELERVGDRNSVFDENVFEDDDDELDELDSLDDQEAMDDAIHLSIRRPSRNGGDTDDEDWQAIGAAKLRRDTAATIAQLSASHSHYHQQQAADIKQPTQDDVVKREQEAIDALVQLKSI